MQGYWSMELPIEEDCQFIDFDKSVVREVPGEDDGKSKDSDEPDFDLIRNLFSEEHWHATE